MFKRAEKRRRKLEEEEELGLTEEMKEVMGMHDTDSDESASDSEEGSSGDDSGDEEAGVEVEEEEKLVSGDEDEEEGDEEGSDEEEEEEEEERPPLSVTEAMTDPIYPLSSKGNVKACSVCPAKRLKDDKMVAEHRESKAHYRRFARFVEFAGTADPETDMDDFWRALDEENKNKAPKPKADGPLSKRAEKRKAKQEAMKERRKKSKEMKAKGMARKAALKAQKIAEADGAAANSANKPPNSPSITGIAEAAKSEKIEENPRPKKKRKISVDEAIDVEEVEAKPVNAPSVPKAQKAKTEGRPATETASKSKAKEDTKPPKEQPIPPPKSPPKQTKLIPSIKSPQQKSKSEFRPDKAKATITSKASMKKRRPKAALQ